MIRVFSHPRYTPLEYLGKANIKDWVPGSKFKMNGKEYLFLYDFKHPDHGTCIYAKAVEDRKIFDEILKLVMNKDEPPTWHLPKPLPGLKDTQWMTYEEATELQKHIAKVEQEMMPEWLKTFLRK